MSIQFKKLKIINGLVYKDQTFLLEEQGLVSILGPNGAGKSTIWGFLSLIFYGSTPSGHSRDDLVSNDEDAHFSIDFEKEGKNYVIAYYRKDSKWNYEISECGNIKKFKGVADSKAWVHKILGLSRAEFEGSIHLTQESQHVLILGKPAERKKYLSEFFGLDDRFDKVLAACEQEIEKVKVKIRDIEGLSHTKQALSEQLRLLPYTEVAPLMEELASLAAKLVVLQNKHTSLKQEIEFLTLYESLAPLAFKFKDPVSSLHVAEKEFVDLKVKKTQILETLDYNSRAAENNNSVTQTTQALQKILKDYPKVEKKSLHTLTEEYRNLKSSKDRDLAVATLRAELATLPESGTIQTEALKHERQNALLNVGGLKRRLAAIQSGVCPECGAEHKGEDIKSVSSEILLYEDLANTLAVDIAAIEANNEKVKRRNWIEKSITSVEPFTNFMEKMLKQLEHLIQGRTLYDKTQALLQGRGLIPLREVHTDATVDSSILAKGQEITLLKSCVSAKSGIPASPTRAKAEMEAELASVISEGTQYQTRHNQIQTEVVSANTSNKMYLKTKEQLEQIETRLQGLPELKQQEFFWNKMSDAYGQRGLRVQQLDRIVQRVLRRLPFYSSKLFKEKDLHFTSEVDSGSVYIIANRKKADGSSFKHDISQFSGGERKRMSLALIVTLADCIPSFKKANLLVLDEIDGALDDLGKFLFVNELLPTLKARFKSVFLISHAEAVQQAAVYDRIWKVEKTDHVSKVVESVGITANYLA